MSDDAPPPFDFIDVRRAEELHGYLKSIMGRIRDLVASDHPSLMELDVLSFDVRVARQIALEIDEALGRNLPLFP